MNTCKNLILLTVIFLFISSFFSCKKEELKIMMVRNDSISDVSYRTAKAYATIIDPGEGIEQHGHCWSTNAESITIDTENKTDNGAKKSAGTYSSTLTNLSPGESYYVRAYVKKGKTVIYGDDVLPFTTLSIGMPEVITGTVKSITTSGATVSANLNSFGAGASSVKQHGHCCSSETTTPTVENSNVSNLGSTDSIGIYESKLVNLSENTLYYVRAYAINDAGTVYGDTISFKTREPLKAEFDANPKSGYLPLSIQFTDMSTGDIKSWSWNFGDGGTSTNQNPSHQYDTPGNYTVVLTVSNSYSTDSETKNNYITVNASGSAPIASFTADKTSITEGEYVSFTDQSVNVPTTWSWNFGDGGTSTNQNPTHQYNTPGNYTVILTVNNSHGTDSETKNNYITVNAGGSAPVANFTADKTSITEGETVNFTDHSTNDPTSWSWNFGDGGTSTNQNPAHQYNTPGNYTVILTVNNSYGTDSETKNNYITVNAGGSAPVANFTADKTSITEGETVNFTDQSTNDPTSWSWNFGDGGTSTNQNPAHQYNTPGNYSVTLTVSNSHGTDSETKNNYITVNAGGSAPVASFTADKTSITEGETVNFTDQSTNDPTSWSWNFGDGGTSTNQNPAHQYDTPGIYTVILTVSNSYGTDSETKNDYINVINIISWQKSLGGSNDDRACSVQQTTDGGYIIAGESTSNDGDVSGNHGAFDYWIVKLISTGSIAWKKSYGGSSEDMEPEIEQTADAGYIIAGTTRSDDGDVSGDPGGSDYWIVRLISEGKFDWQKPLGGTGTDRGYSITQTTDGDYIIAGYSTSDDGDVTGNHGSSDYWIVKLTSAGNIDWQKSLGGSGTDRAYSIKQTNDGGYIIAGYSNSNDGDVTGNHGGTDYWIVKLTSAGNIDWQKSLGGSGTDKAYSIQQTTDGGYIIAGSSNSNDGDVSGNHGGYDYWIVKLTSTGDIEWQKSRGGSNDDYAKSIQQTNDGGYIVAGDAESNDGNVTGNHGGNDYWIVKLTSAGNIDWQKSFGGSGADRALSIQQTADEGYIIAGYSDSNDGDVTGNHGGSDYWIVKIY